MKRLFINNRHGVVHLLRSDGVTCPEATRTMRRMSVTPLQCLVYRLPCCFRCWSGETTYDHYIRYAYYFNQEDT